MSGATATVSTLVTVVGQPNTPTSAGNGGFNRGLPWKKFVLKACRVGAAANFNSEVKKPFIDVDPLAFWAWKLATKRHGQRWHRSIVNIYFCFSLPRNSLFRRQLHLEVLGVFLSCFVLLKPTVYEVVRNYDFFLLSAVQALFCSNCHKDSGLLTDFLGGWHKPMLFSAKS